MDVVSQIYLERTDTFRDIEGHVMFAAISRTLYCRSILIMSRNSLVLMCIGFGFFYIIVKLHHKKRRWDTFQIVLFRKTSYIIYAY